MVAFVVRGELNAVRNYMRVVASWRQGNQDLHEALLQKPHIVRGSCYAFDTQTHVQNNVKHPVTLTPPTPRSSLITPANRSVVYQYCGCCGNNIRLNIIQH